MKQRMMKLVALLTCATMVVGSFAACGGGDEDVDKPNDGQEDGDDTDGEDTDGEDKDGEEETYDFDGKVVKVYGSIWDQVDNADNVQAVQAKEFVEKKYNIKLEKAAIAPEDGQTPADVLVASVVSGKPATDIISLSTETMVTCFKSDILFDMTDCIDELKIGSKFIEAATWEGKCYGVSCDDYTQTWLMIYDRELFKDTGCPTPTEMFMQGKWDYDSFKEYCSSDAMKTVLQKAATERGVDKVYAIANYPYHWFLMSAGTSGSAVARFDANANIELGYNDEAVIEALDFYRELEELGIAYPLEPDGDIPYQKNDARILMARCEDWELSGVENEFGVVYWPWNSKYVEIDESKIGQADAYTTLSEEYRLSRVYWSFDAVVNDSCDQLGIPGDVMMHIIYDYRSAWNGEDGLQWMHDAYETEQAGDTAAGPNVGMPRQFVTEEDIELFDWAGTRTQFDWGWNLNAGGGMVSLGGASNLVLIERQDARSALESYYNSAKAALEDAGLTVAD